MNYTKALRIITDWFHSYTDSEGRTVHEQHITEEYEEALKSLRQLVDEADWRDVEEIE